MRAIAVLALLAACGRFGFDGDGVLDASTRGSDDDATVSDGRVLGSCTVQMTTGMDLSSVGSVVRDIGFAQVPAGYALAFVMDAQSSVYGFQLDTNLTPTSSTPVQTTPVGNGGGAYTGVSMRWDGTNLDAVIGAADNSVWLKTFTLDMNDFIIAEQRTSSGLPEPALAAANGTPISVWFTNDTLYFTALSASGAPVGDVSASTVTPIARASVASGAPAMVITEYSNGACRYTWIASTSNYGGGPLPSACRRPRVRALDATTFIVAYEAGTNVATRTLSSDGSMVSAETIIGPGSEPIFIDVGSAPAVVYRTATGLEGVDVASGNPVPGLRITAQIDAFESAGDRLFFATAGQPRSISCK